VNCRGAHACSVLVSAFCRNDLSETWDPKTDMAGKTKREGYPFGKVHERLETFASTPEACAPQNSNRDVVEVPCRFALNLTDVTRF